MSKRTTATVLTCALFVALAGCTSGNGATVDRPTGTPTTLKPVNVTEHESGPESPITYGFEVPSGATQLGPLVRYRSARLIATYQPELDAAIAQKAAEAKNKAEQQAEEDGSPVPSTIPTPDSRPSGDTFKLIDNPPKPDTTISLMRIDGKPSDVVRRMLAQISAALPDSDVSINDLSKYCASTRHRITSCRLAVRGLTVDERDIRVTMTVDPGDVVTRTSPPSSKRRPVMTLTIEYVGEPRKGQLTRQSNNLKDVPSVQSGGDTSGLIWPKMDEDAPPTVKLVHGWTAPADSTIILSGFEPKFVAITTPKAVDSDIVALEFAQANGFRGVYTKDVVEDLNAVSTTYTSTSKSGAVARATYVLSARGNYAMLFYYPPPN
jgi:hypothetical protein